MAGSDGEWRVGDDATVDYRPFMPPVRSQGPCGSCWAFACVGTLEGVLLQKAHDPRRQAPLLDLSEQTLLSCLGSCRGYYMRPALERLVAEGTFPEVCAPYRASDSRTFCRMTCDGQSSVRLSEFRREEGVNRSGPPHDRWILATRQLLRERGPLAVVMRVPEDFFHYGRGVYRATTDRTAGYHAVVLVGYSDPGRYWIARNSWGVRWGEQGNFRVSWDDERTLFGLELYSAAVPGHARPPEPDPEDPQPAFVRLSAATRERLAALDGSLRLPCDDSDPSRPAPVLLEAVVEDGGHEPVTSAEAARTEVHLYINGIAAGRLEFADGRHAVTFPWTGVSLRTTLAVEVRGTWQPATPPEKPPRPLVGDLQELRLALPLTRTDVAIAPVTAELVHADAPDRLEGAVAVPLGRYLALGQGCGAVSFRTALAWSTAGPSGRGSVVPARVAFDGRTETAELRLRLACNGGACEPATHQGTLTFTLEGDTDPPFVLTIPLAARFAASWFDRARPALAGAGFFLAFVLGFLLVRRMVAVDKWRHFRDRIAPVSPGDFWPDPELWPERAAAQVAVASADLAEFLHTATPKAALRFARAFSWAALRRLEARVRTPVATPQRRSLAACGTVRIGAFEPGADVIRLRDAALPADLARIVPRPGGDGALFYPQMGYFTDASGRHCPLEQPLVVAPRLVVSWGEGTTPIGEMTVTSAGDDVVVAFQRRA